MTMRQNGNIIFTQKPPHANATGIKQWQDDFLNNRRMETTTRSTCSANGANGVAGMDGVIGVVDKYGVAANPPP